MTISALPGSCIETKLLEVSGSDYFLARDREHAHEKIFHVLLGKGVLEWQSYEPAQHLFHFPQPWQGVVLSRDGVHGAERHLLGPEVLIDLFNRVDVHVKNLEIVY